MNQTNGELLLKSQAARQLRSLLTETGLIDKLAARLFNEWLSEPPEKWVQVKIKLELIGLADNELRRMEAAGAEPERIAD